MTKAKKDEIVSLARKAQRLAGKDDVTGEAARVSALRRAVGGGEEEFELPPVSSDAEWRGFFLWLPVDGRPLNFEDGFEIQKRWTDVAPRLERVTHERNRLIAHSNKLLETIQRGGGPFADGSFARDDEEEIRAERERIGQEIERLNREIEELGVEVEEIRREARAFVAIQTSAPRLPATSVQH